MLRALLADPAFGTRGSWSSSRWSGSSARCGSSAYAPATCPRTAQAAAERAQPARPGAAATAERRRLARRRGVADHVGDAGPAEAGAAAGRAAARPVLDRLGAAPQGQRVDALARLLVVDAFTDRTRAALTPAAGDPRKLLALGLASPEYAIAEGGAHGHRDPAQVPDHQRRRRRRRPGRGRRVDAARHPRHRAPGTTARRREDPRPGHPVRRQRRPRHRHPVRREGLPGGPQRAGVRGRGGPPARRRLRAEPGA